MLILKKVFYYFFSFAFFVGYAQACLDDLISVEAELTRLRGAINSSELNSLPRSVRSNYQSQLTSYDEQFNNLFQQVGGSSDGALSVAARALRGRVQNTVDQASNVAEAIRLVTTRSSADTAIGGQALRNNSVLTESLASELGYRRVGGASSSAGGQRQTIFERIERSSVPGRERPRFISLDMTSHNGGVWKGANSVEAIHRRTTRLGSYSWDLDVRLGD